MPTVTITPIDVRDRWVDGEIALSDNQLTTVLNDAVDVVLSEVPNIDELLASGAVPEDRYKRVIAGMVIRYLRNPSGVRTVQETTGQFSGSTTFAGDTLGELVFTDADRRALLGKAARVGRKAFSVMPGGGVL